MANMPKLRGLDLGQLDTLIETARTELRRQTVTNILEEMVTRNVTIEDLQDAGAPRRGKVVEPIKKDHLLANTPVNDVRYQNPIDKRQQWTSRPSSPVPAWYLSCIRDGMTEQQLRVPLKKRGDTTADKEHRRRGCVAVRAGAGVLTHKGRK